MIEPVSHDELCRDGKPIYISALDVDDQTIDLAIDLEPPSSLVPSLVPTLGVRIGDSPWVSQ